MPRRNAESTALFARLRRRRRLPELMDQPGLDRSRHFEALRGLERINHVSRSSYAFWPAVRRMARSSGQPVRVLDLATGAGDVPIGLWRLARRAGIELEIAGCDRSSQALEYARQRAREQRAEVRFFALDALAEQLPAGYDVLMCSLFLHHLDDGQAEDLLRRMALATRRLVLVADLRRGRDGYLLAWVGTRLLSRSAIVHTDGPRSVEAALTLAEARALARRAGLEDATVEPRWPCRYVLTWRHP